MSFGCCYPHASPDQRQVDPRPCSPRALVHPFQLVVSDRYIVLTHSQEAAAADDDVCELARFIEDVLADVANLFVSFIVDVNANEF
jgi:hypothetical protein